MRKLFFTLFVMLSFMALPSSAQSSLKGDVNEDGTVDISDVVELVNIILNGSDVQSYLTCPDDHHPHLIDLGLPSGTKWSCCNVGADKPEAYGGYYAWGETEEKSVYDWSTYIHCDGEENTCHNLGSDIAGTQYDVAHVKWGGSWVMPSKEQMDELVNNCTFEETTVNDVDGFKFTSKTNGGSIFLPATGCRLDSELSFASGGSCWSSTLSKEVLDEENCAYYLYFSKYGPGSSSTNRIDGRSVRPVQ